MPCKQHYIHLQIRMDTFTNREKYKCYHWQCSLFRPSKNAMHALHARWPQLQHYVIVTTNLLLDWCKYKFTKLFFLTPCTSGPVCYHRRSIRFPVSVFLSSALWALHFYILYELICLRKTLMWELLKLLTKRFSTWWDAVPRMFVPLYHLVLGWVAEHSCHATICLL